MTILEFFSEHKPILIQPLKIIAEAFSISKTEANRMIKNKAIKIYRNKVLRTMEEAELLLIGDVIKLGKRRFIKIT